MVRRLSLSSRPLYRDAITRNKGDVRSSFFFGAACNPRVSPPVRFGRHRRGPGCPGLSSTSFISSHVRARNKHDTNKKARRAKERIKGGIITSCLFFGSLSFWFGLYPSNCLFCVRNNMAVCTTSRVLEHHLIMCGGFRRTVKWYTRNVWVIHVSNNATMQVVSGNLPMYKIKTATELKSPFPTHPLKEWINTMFFF